MIKPLIEIGRVATEESGSGMDERAAESSRATWKIRESGDFNIGLIDFTERTITTGRARGLTT